MLGWLSRRVNRLRQVEGEDVLEEGRIEGCDLGAREEATPLPPPGSGAVPSQVSQRSDETWEDNIKIHFLRKWPDGYPHRYRRVKK